MSLRLEVDSSRKISCGYPGYVAGQSSYYYSGREAPSHKMSSFFVVVANFALWTLTGLRPDDMFFVVCWSCVRESTWAERCRPAMCALLELFVGMLISLTNTYTGCSRPTLNLIECIDLGCSVLTAKPLHLITYVQNVDQNMNVWIWTWRCFAFYALCFSGFVLSYIVLSFFVLFYATQVKHQKIWHLFWKSHSVKWFCCDHYVWVPWRSKTHWRTNYIMIDEL